MHTPQWRVRRSGYAQFGVVFRGGLPCRPALRRVWPGDAGATRVPAAGWVTIVLLVFNLYEWLSNGNYFVNNKSSLIYMGLMYLLAIVLYIVARLVRRRQGIDLGLINKEIPVE